MTLNGEHTIRLIDAGPLDDLIRTVEALQEELKRHGVQINHFQTYPHLGPWLTQPQALELLPIDDTRTLKKWVDAGVIRAHDISASGNKKAYSKADILNFGPRAESYLKGEKLQD